MPLFPQKVKAIREEKHCDLFVTEWLMTNELYLCHGLRFLWGSSYVESSGSTSGKTRALIFPWIDANWQWNAFLTSLSPSATPLQRERDELPTPEIIPSLTGKNHQGLGKSVGTQETLFLIFFYSLFASKNVHRRHRFRSLFPLRTYRAEHNF